MKLHFEPYLDYQLQAIDAVCDLFRGQEICRTEFTVVRDVGRRQLSHFDDETGVGNRLDLLDDEILANLHEIQLRNGLPPSKALDSGDFTVEMETGTGKTYVYLRTIFELNRRYGFTKFIVVVPSVAIKEGVFHTLKVAEDHLKSLYGGVPVDFFIYDSGKLGQVRSFATSPHINIMIITVGAINKFGDEDEPEASDSADRNGGKGSRNSMYRVSEKTDGERPIDLIRKVRPILVVDEPQSVEGGLDGKGRQAMQRMKPLFSLRYSATPRHAHHMVYRLDAVDAYEKKLVKQIEVASATVEGGHNKPYVRFLEIVRRGKSIAGAKIELDVASRRGVARKVVTVEPGDDLEQITGRDIYRDHRIGAEISETKDGASLELRCPGGEEFLVLGSAYGGIDSEEIARQMIRRTIKEHLEKEKRLRPLGIKVLSLFFIDSVAKYRGYDSEGGVVPGVYATLFENEYRKIASATEYKALFEGVDIGSMLPLVHGGYFTVDKEKKKGKTIEKVRDTRGNTKLDDDTYRLIMRDKERLLSLDTPLKFIFSHSALREGWDNPNVFQICALREMSSEQQRRQTIGRGLRLCVRAEGNDFVRVRGFDVNTLTVIASENYEQFAQKLQREIEEETGLRFGVVQPHQFAGIRILDENGMTASLGFEQSSRLKDFLVDAGYIKSDGLVTDVLRSALKEGTLALPEQFAPVISQVEGILRKVTGRLDIKNADERKSVKSRKEKLGGTEFRELWERIKHKTTYRVYFDNEELIKSCSEKLRDAPQITRTRLQWRKADLSIGMGGVEAREKASSGLIALAEEDVDLPDILTELQNKTQLTRRSISRILHESTRLDDFRKNPQQFIALAAEVIDRTKRAALVDGIKYQRIGDSSYYAQELFETQELTGYLRTMVAVERCIYEEVVYDSQTELDFVTSLEKNEAIKVYTKLPGWFTVSTPLGSYNPDWAVVVESDGIERLFLVVETKSSIFGDDLRSKELAKIVCAKEHFKALAVHENSAAYRVATTLEEVLGDL